MLTENKTKLKFLHNEIDMLMSTLENNLPNAHAVSVIKINLTALKMIVNIAVDQQDNFESLV